MMNVLLQLVLLVGLTWADDALLAVPGTRRLACGLAVGRGSRCRAALQRFYFNTETEQCESFIYGGCDGNANRFIDFQQCSDYCKPGVCTAPMCAMFCPNGFKADANGCRTCDCLQEGETLDISVPSECPLMKCQAIYCPNGFQKDSRGCQTCECAPDGSKVEPKAGLRSQCSPIMCNMYCENGFKKDGQSCEICACNESPTCPESVIATCTLYCEHGLKKDARGCTVCECNDTPTCPNPISVTCNIYCENGMKTDQHGCPVCQCNEEPTCPDQNIPQCSMHCQHGMRKDARGCPMCECNDKPQCPNTVGPACSMYCEHGFQTDERGCAICKCKEETLKCQKSMVACMMYCPHGFQKDSEGCDVCKCRGSPVCPAPDAAKSSCRMFCRYASGMMSTDGQSSCGVCRCRVPPLTEPACEGLSLSCEVHGCPHQRGAFYAPDNLDNSQCWDDQCQGISCSEDEKCVVDYLTMQPKCIPGRRWCPNVKCKMYCERGYMTDEYGCDVCRCRTEDEPECTDGASTTSTSCQYGNRYNENGCRTTDCLLYPCTSDYKCAMGSVCEAYRVKDCHFCPTVPRCIETAFVQQAVISMEYTHDSKEIDLEDFRKLLPGSLSTMLEVDEAKLMNLSVKAVPDRRRTSIKVHLVSNVSNVDPVSAVQLMADKLERGDETISISVDGELVTPDAATMIAAYRSDDYECTAVTDDDADDGCPVWLIVVIVIGCVFVVAAITIPIVVCCCCKKPKKETTYKATPQRDSSFEAYRA